MGRETRTAAQLHAMVQLRVDELPEVIEFAQRTEGAKLVVGPVEAIRPDHQGRNWDIRTVAGAVGFMGHLRAIVDDLRSRYDLIA